MRKLILLFLCIAIVLPTVFSGCNSVFASFDGDVYSYLLLGIDDAGNNTDVLGIASYNAADNAISVFQIPRDTYYNANTHQNKINQLYPKLLSEGKSPEQALTEITEAVARDFDIRLRGYISIDSQSFINMIDAIGGVTITIPENFSYFEDFHNIGIDLDVGENLLSGADAFKFVRHREGYLRGDLARIEVQKLFFAGIFDTVKDYTTNVSAYGFIAIAKENLRCDFSLLDIVLMVLKHSSKFKMVSFMYLTLPGEAYQNDSGLWLYQLNKYKTEEVLSRYLSYNGAFNSSGAFFDAKSKTAERIYYDRNISYNIYVGEHNSETNE